MLKTELILLSLSRTLRASEQKSHGNQGTVRICLSVELLGGKWR